jgi:hypothetical protein
MGFHPTALLSGLLLVLLASDLQDVKTIANQKLRSSNQATSATQLADATVHTFHRGSGRRQLFRELMLLEA